MIHRSTRALCSTRRAAMVQEKTGDHRGASFWSSSPPPPNMGGRSTRPSLTAMAASTADPPASCAGPKTSPNKACAHRAAHSGSVTRMIDASVAETLAKAMVWSQMVNAVETSAIHASEASASGEVTRSPAKALTDATMSPPASDTVERPAKPMAATATTRHWTAARGLAWSGPNCSEASSSSTYDAPNPTAWPSATRLPTSDE
mmetsp:Transcript_10284/g.41618  ORF Transcript_10284/g.41618 Transcript_10284/m.41618 type:complete len:204 (+) Transcript_10284:2176-2787(+)